MLPYSIQIYYMLRSAALSAFLAAEVQSALSVLVPSQPPKRSTKAIKYSQSVTLSFSLLNEDASLGGGIDDWEIERAIEGGFDTYPAT
jgi:hypothetical protein